MSGGTWFLLGFLVALVIGAMAWLAGRLRGVPAVWSSGGKADTAARVLHLPPDLLPHALGSGLRGVRGGDVLAILNPSDAGQAMIFGDPDVAAKYGEVVGPIPGQLAALVVGSNALIQAGISMGEQSGMLVRLTADSTRLFRQLEKTVDGSGAIMGVLRDAGGQFKHVIRFRPAIGLQALSGVTGALSAIAMQAQLAAIEREIRALAEDVHRVQVSLDIHATSRRVGVAEVLREVYEGSTSCGVLTQSAWDQIAPIASDVYRNSDFTKRELRAMLDELASKKSTGDRRGWLEKNQGRLIHKWIEAEQAEQAVLQYARLRLWWLATTADPALTHFVDDLSVKIVARQHRKGELAKAVREGLNRAGRTNRFDSIHSPFDTRALEKIVDRLSASLQEVGLLEIDDVRALVELEVEPVVKQIDST